VFVTFASLAIRCFLQGNESTYFSKHPPAWRIASNLTSYGNSSKVILSW